MVPLLFEPTCEPCSRVSASLPSFSTTLTNQIIQPEMGKYISDHVSGAKYVELPGRNL